MGHINSFRFVYWNILKLHKNATNKQLHDERIANVICRLKPNIVSLCEVSDKEQLDYIGEKISTSRRKFSSYFVKSTDTRTCQNTGLLTTIKPIITPFVFSKHISKHYMAQFRFGQLNFALISCHLLANPQSEHTIVQRERQARELKLKIDSLVNSGCDVLLAGDLNDFDNDVQDASSSKSISNVLSIIKDNNALRNINNLIRQNDRYTYTYERNNVMIDHVLVTKGLYNAIKKISIHHIKEKTINDSDHDPIVVDFLI